MGRKNTKRHPRRQPACPIRAIKKGKPQINYEEIARSLVARGLASKVILDKPQREWIPQFNSQLKEN